MAVRSRRTKTVAKKPMKAPGKFTPPAPFPKAAPVLPKGCDPSDVDLVVVLRRNKAPNPVKGTVGIGGVVMFYNRSGSDRTLQFEHSPFKASMGSGDITVPDGECVKRQVKDVMKVAYVYKIDPPTVPGSAGSPPDPPEIVVGDRE